MLSHPPEFRPGAPTPFPPPPRRSTCSLLIPTCTLRSARRGRTLSHASARVECGRPSGAQHTCVLLSSTPPSHPALSVNHSCRTSLPSHQPSLVYTIGAAPRAAARPETLLPPSSALAFVACSLSGALAACLLAAIPTLLALKRAADELSLLAATIRDEVPDTAAAVRLSGLELSDAFEEVGGLTADVGSGLRSSARALAAAEAGVRAVGSAVRTRALPAVKRRLVPVAKEAVARSQELLAERAGMESYSGPAIQAVAETTATGVSKLRTALQAAGVARNLGRAIKYVRSSVMK